MKSGTVPLAIFFALCLLGGIVWICRGSSLPVEAPPPKPVPEPGLKISEKGPHPKAVADKLEHDFGVMEVAEERKYKFVLRNKGKAVLELKKGTTTCMCAVSELARSKIPVGESVEIEIAWKPTSLGEAFEQRVTIYTNDPENQEITLTVRGRVQEAVVMSPPDGWNVGEISDETPTKVSGVLHSAIQEEFKVLSIDSSHELLTAEAVPMTEDEMKEVGAKSGYNILVTLATGLETGRFHGQLTIRTDVGDGTNFAVSVNGRRPGPITIWPLRGVTWIAEANLLELGKFSSRKGSSAKLQLFISGLGEKEFELVDIQADPDFLKVTLTPDPSFKVGDRRRYYLTFEVPAGSPAFSAVGKSPAKVIVKTNHPEAEKLEFRVRFVSL